MTDTTTYILLPVLNGRPYLARLLESLQAQSEDNWILLVRDDLSQDGTEEIIASFAERDPRIKLLPAGPHLGVARSFDLLLRTALETKAETFYFCDGDDIWHPDKLKILNEVLKKTARKFGGHTPILAHSDLQVVDAQENMLAPSLLAYAGWQRRTGPEARLALLTGNFVTGCSAVLNRAAARLVTPIPEDAGLHDGWSALLVAWAGSIQFVPQKLVNYRLHGGNAVGVTPPMSKIFNWLKRLPGSLGERVQLTERRIRRAGAARARLLSRGFGAENLPGLDEFVCLPQLPPMMRIPAFFRLRFPWHSRLGRLAFLLSLPWVCRARALAIQDRPQKGTD